MGALSMFWFVDESNCAESIREKLQVPVGWSLDASRQNGNHHSHAFETRIVAMPVLLAPILRVVIRRHLLVVRHGLLLLTDVHTVELETEDGSRH